MRYKTEEERKDYQITVRLAKKEYDFLKAQAGIWEKPISQILERLVKDMMQLHDKV